MTLSSILTMIINPDALEILPTGKTYFPKLSKFDFTFPGTLCNCSFSAWGGGGVRVKGLRCMPNNIYETLS